jgi:hypothetical protein
MLYWMLNPPTVVTDGKLKADAHVLDGAMITGAVGKITTLTVLLTPHDPLPGVPANVPPQSVASTYLAVTV